MSVSIWLRQILQSSACNYVCCFIAFKGIAKVQLFTARSICQMVMIATTVMRRIHSTFSLPPPKSISTPLKPRHNSDAYSSAPNRFWWFLHPLRLVLLFANSGVDLIVWNDDMLQIYDGVSKYRHLLSSRVSNPTYASRLQDCNIQRRWKCPREFSKLIINFIIDGLRRRCLRRGKLGIIWSFLKFSIVIRCDVQLHKLKDFPHLRKFPSSFILRRFDRNLHQFPFAHW